MTASRLKRSFVPQFDMLEDRCVPAAVSVSNIFSIASQVYQNQAQLGAFKANPTAFEATAAARASAINQLDQILGESKSEIASLQAINDQATKTAQGQIASLEKYRAQQDTAIVNEYNQEIKDFNKFLSQFDGATQKAFADQIAQYKNALAQDASAKLIRTGDYVNGQEVLSIQYVSKLQTVLVPILNAAEQNLQDAAKDETAINQSSSSNSSAGGNQTLTGGWFFKTKSALVGEPDFIGGPFATKQAAQAALDSRIENVFEGDKTAITLQVTHFN